MGSLKMYGNSYGSFRVTRIVTEHTEWDPEKQVHVKLKEPRVTETVIFAARDLYTLADVVRACDIVSDSEGAWYDSNKVAPSERVLKVEFDLEVEQY